MLTKIVSSASAHRLLQASHLIDSGSKKYIGTAVKAKIEHQKCIRTQCGFKYAINGNASWQECTIIPLMQ